MSYQSIASRCATGWTGVSTAKKQNHRSLTLAAWNEALCSRAATVRESVPLDHVFKGVTMRAAHQKVMKTKVGRTPRSAWVPLDPLFLQQADEGVGCGHQGARPTYVFKGALPRKELALRSLAVAVR